MLPLELNPPGMEVVPGQGPRCSMDLSAGLLPLELLLDGSGPVAAAAPPHLPSSASQPDLLASLLSIEDPMAVFDFGLDLPGGPSHAVGPVPAPQRAAAPDGPQGTACVPSTSTSSCRSDGVVPAVPPSPTSMWGPALLPSEPSSPLLPAGARVVTTGVFFGGRPEASPQLVPFQEPRPSPFCDAAPAHAAKPAPVTTVAAATVAGGSQRRAAALLPGAPRAAARLARSAAGHAASPAGASSFDELSPFSSNHLPESARMVPCAPSPPTAPAAVPYDAEMRAEKLARYRAKRARRNFQKRVRYQTRKDYADVRPRIKGRFVSPEEYAAWRAEQEALGGDRPSGLGQEERAVPSLKRRR